MIDILGQSALMLGVTSFALGLSVLARDVRNILFLAFATLTLLISGWSLAFFLHQVWPERGCYAWHLLFNLWLGPAGLFFVRVMVRMRDRRSLRLLYLAICGSALLSGVLAFKPQAQPFWVLQWIYFAPVVIVFQTLHLMWIDFQARRGRILLQKLPTVGLKRKNLIYAGALVVLATSMMDHVEWLGHFVPALGNLALCVYLFFLSQAITQQRLLNLGALLSRLLVLLTVALTLTLVYSFLVAWIENSPGLFFLNSFIASFLILMLLDPLRALVSYFTQRLLTQKHRKLQALVREAQGQLTGVVEKAALFQAVLQLTEQTLHPTWAALFVIRADGIRLRRVRTVGGGEKQAETAAAGAGVTSGGASSSLSSVGVGRSKLQEVLVHSPILRHCEYLSKQGKFPVVLDQLLENEIDRSASKTQRENLAILLAGLKALGGNLLIPLLDAGRILGFLILAVDHPPEPWGNNWGLLPIVYPYFQQAADSLRNMEVYARSREKDRLAALGEMAAGLAHEIRNPLGAILGAAQFLDPSIERPESRFLQIIIEEVGRLNRVVSDFLDYSKTTFFNWQKLDLVDLAAKTVQFMQPAMATQVSLAFVAPRDKVWVEGMAEQLQQVLINLIHNAQKALLQKPEGGKIWVTIEQEGDSLPHRMQGVLALDAKVDEVALIIEDTGVGIKKEHLDKLFIPFFTTSPQGTGLGLSICQKIVEAHRGRIEVVSEENSFSRFAVILPRMQEGSR